MTPVLVTPMLVLGLLDCGVLVLLIAVGVRPAMLRRIWQVGYF